jgi:catechol 1,2-dioxygenase
MNNGTDDKPTSANLLGPFWRKGSPTMKNDDSIVRSPTLGPPRAPPQHRRRVRS